LLDSLERSFGHFAGSPEAKPDARSQLPEVIYAFLLYPAVDTLWLQTALDLHERVVRKLIKRLADAGLIVHWADKRARESRGREVRLWTAAEFERDFQMAISNRERLPASRPSPTAMIERYRDAYISKPMRLVFERFDQEMMDSDREFGRFSSNNSGKIDPLRALLSEISTNPETRTPEQAWRRSNGLKIDSLPQEKPLQARVRHSFP